jgi:N utilization substance protein B
LNNEDSGVIDAHIRQAHGFDKADREHFDALLHGAINNSIALREDFAPLIDRDC